ncbi:MAG: ABC transporter ATP-binding protein, partial [Pseudomonadota bacterium]
MSLDDGLDGHRDPGAGLRPEGRFTAGMSAFGRRIFSGFFDPFDAAEGPPPRRLVPFGRWLLTGASPAIWAFAIVSLLLGLAEALSAWIIGWVIDLAGAAGPERFFADHWGVLLAAGLFLLLVRPALMILSSGLSSITVSPGLMTKGVWQVHRHTMGQALRYFQDDYAGRISQKELQTANAITSIVNETLNAAAYGLAAVIGAVVVLGQADWRLAAILAVWFATFVAVTARHLPRIRARAKARADVRSTLSGTLVDQIGHIETVKLFAHTGREEARAREGLERYWDSALAFGGTVWTFRNYISVLAGVLPVTLIATGFWFWHLGTATIGDVAMAGLLGMRLAQMTGWISFTAMSIFAEIGTLEDGMRTLSPAHELVDRPDAVAPSARAKGAIRFEDVRFQYGRARADGGGGLDGVDLAIAPGERVALVGPSGAGKSTLVATLLRLHDVEAGRVTLDGHDVRDLRQEWLRRQVATVTQEPALFNRSARENILYGRPEAGHDAAVEAARRAAADGFIRDIRDPRGRQGYDAHLGERGVKLSGGQRQRI